MLRPEEVEILVCGSPKLDLRELQKNTVYTVCVYIDLKHQCCGTVEEAIDFSHWLADIHKCQYVFDLKFDGHLV